jgi:hypothetical protein
MLIDGCWDRRIGTDFLHERLRPFELGREPVWSEHGNFCDIEAISQTIDQGPFGSNDDQTDIILVAKRDDCAVIADIEVDACRFLRNPGVARRSVECIAKRRLRELPRQRMFASATTDEQDIHEYRFSRG